MKTKNIIEVVLLTITNLLILISADKLSSNLNHSPFPGEQPYVQLFYILGFIGVVLDLFVLFRKKPTKTAGFRFPKILLILFVLIHLVANSLMFLFVKYMMNL